MEELIKELCSIKTKYNHINQSTYPHINILFPGGCSWQKNGGPCKMCSFQYAIEQNFQMEEVPSSTQIDIATAIIIPQNGSNGYAVSIYNGGSWSNITPEARKILLKKISENKNINQILIESRPEFITDQMIQEIKKIFNGQLIIGIGLESQSDFVRNILINKGFSKTEFEKAVKVCLQNDVIPWAYIFIKAPGLNESDVINEVILSVKYAFETGVKICSLESAFVQPGSKLFEMWGKNLFTPPWLWTIIEILKSVYKMGSINLGYFDDEPPPQAKPKNCDKCTFEISNALDDFRLDNNLHELLSSLPECECKNVWKQNNKL